MKYLFVHQNFPGQYLHIVRHLVASKQHDLVFITEPNGNRIAGVRAVPYAKPRGAAPEAHVAARELDGAVRRAEVVAHTASNLKKLGFEPDIILTGKGIASGYAPLGAVLVASHVVEAYEKGTASFMHGFTYQAHPVATAAGNAVFDYWAAHKLFDRVTPAGETLRNALSSVASHPNVGQVRGLGLLQGIEFVKDKSTREPFPKEARIAEKIRQTMLEKNVLVYPGQGCLDGTRGDHILLAPPFIITPQECQLIADALQYALGRVFSA